MRLHPGVRVTVASMAFATCAPASRPPSEPVNTTEPLIQMRMARLSPAVGYVPMQAAIDGRIAYVTDTNIVDDRHVVRASAHPGASGLLVEVWFSAEGGARLYAATSTSIGLHAALLIGGRLAYTAVIAGPIGLSDGPVAMGIKADERTASDLAARIVAKWPVPAP